MSKDIFILVYISSTLRDIVQGEKESSPVEVARMRVTLSPSSVELIVKPWLCRADLKHSSRRPWAKRPAWYSFPSIIDGTVSVSCTMTAISLSRFPSMLRSLMLAEPKSRISRHAQTSSCDSHHQYRPHSMLPGSQNPNSVNIIEGRCSSRMWWPPWGWAQVWIYHSMSAIVMLSSLSVISLRDGTWHSSEPWDMKECSWGLLRKKNFVPSFPSFGYWLQKIHSTASHFATTRD